MAPITLPPPPQGWRSDVCNESKRSGVVMALQMATNNETAAVIIWCRNGDAPSHVEGGSHLSFRWGVGVFQGLALALRVAHKIFAKARMVSVCLFDLVSPYLP